MTITISMNVHVMVTSMKMLLWMVIRMTKKQGRMMVTVAAEVGAVLREMRVVLALASVLGLAPSLAHTHGTQLALIQNQTAKP